MQKNHYFLFISLILFCLVGLIPHPTEAVGDQSICTKPYYKPTDIVGYFISVYDNESYYITTDWCVVKAILWYGSVLGYGGGLVNEALVKKNIDYIFPEKQVYFGLIPAAFLDDGGSRPRRGAFTTKGQKTYGYFLNDNPFKNIYAGNFPKPPRYVNDPNFKLATAKGSLAPLFYKRMEDLNTIFEKYIVKGYCRIPEFVERFGPICDYFSTRTVPFAPGSYYGFNKLPEYNP